MYDLPPGFGSADSADQHLGFAHTGTDGASFNNPLAAPSALGEAGSFLTNLSPTYLALGGAVVFGGVGGLLGSQKDMKTGLIAGGGAAVVGGLLGYFAPSIVAKMAGK
jgi:hypothetical protein